MAKAVVLLSGGMDSSTLLHMVKYKFKYEEVHAVAFDYGQRHSIELEAAQNVASEAGVSLKEIKIDLTQFGGSPLTDPNIKIPKAAEGKQSVTVVPARNAIFLSLAAGYAGTLGGRPDLFHGANLDDFKSYPDCRDTFFSPLSNALIASGEIGGVFAPFTIATKTDIIKLGLNLGVPYELTHTCYEGMSPACGECDACVERLAGFAGNDAKDPIPYVERAS